MPQGYETYLQQALAKYRNPDSTKRDVLTAIQHYRGLFPKLESYVFNDGGTKELLNLDGTVPVHYKGNTYNIPVCIWLLETHPYNPPICYVKPTADMQIKVSRHVDQSGKVYLPYLHEWKYNSSDLLGLIQVMVIVFAEQPPVYSKPRTIDPPLPMPVSQPPPPPPVTHNSAVPPPYPTATGQQYMPMPSVGGTQPVPPPSTPSYPPPYPASTYAPVSTGYGYQAPRSLFNPSSGAPGYPPYPSSTGGYGSASPYSSYPPPQPATTTTTSTSSTGYPYASNSNTITEEHIKASLLSAVEEKLRRRLREVHAQAQAEMDVLKRTQDDLNRGKAKLENMINKLEQEQLDLEKNIMVLREKNEAMSDLISKMQTQEQIDVDEAVITTAPLYKQLLNAFAEENAIEDAIYYLGEALRRQVIDLDVFLKHVRELSRKQFMLRALMQKCRETANLPV